MFEKYTAGLFGGGGSKNGEGIRTSPKAEGQKIPLGCTSNTKKPYGRRRGGRAQIDDGFGPKA